jgi:hypothetical protein
MCLTTIFFVVVEDPVSAMIATPIPAPSTNTAVTSGTVFRTGGIRESMVQAPKS